MIYAFIDVKFKRCKVWVKGEKIVINNKND